MEPEYTVVAARNTTQEVTHGYYCIVGGGAMTELLATTIAILAGAAIAIAAILPVAALVLWRRR